MLPLFRPRATTSATAHEKFLPSHEWRLFLDVVSSQSEPNESILSVNSHEQWFQSHLRAKLEQITPELLECSVLGIFLRQRILTSVELRKLWQLLAHIATSIAQVDYITIKEMVITSQENNLIIENSSQNHACQLVFILAGLITTIYDPILNPRAGFFEISLPNTNGRIIRQDTWVKGCVEIEHASTPLVDLLRRFGGTRGILPEPRQANSPLPNTDAIGSLNLCFSTISLLAEMEIEWVDSICSHLDFDRHRKVLRLYRIPSFCAVLCEHDTLFTFLNRFFQNYFHILERNDFEEQFHEGDYLREVIASYRLIFGQNRHSYQAFAAKYGNAIAGETDSQGPPDPLLGRLCGQDWSKECLYEDMSINHVKTVYSARYDFPFLAEKLRTLEDYVITQFPDNFWTLWLDRRDVSRYWALWAALVLGGVTTVLSILQLIVGVIQVTNGP